MTTCFTSHHSEIMDLLWRFVQKKHDHTLVSIYLFRRKSELSFDNFASPRLAGVEMEYVVNVEHHHV